MPIASNEIEAGRQRNRRVKIIVSGDMIGDRVSPYSGSKPLNSPLIPRNNDSPAIQTEHNSDADHNFALKRMASSSAPCNVNEGPEKAFNGSASAGLSDKWCSHAKPAFLQVDLGGTFAVNEFVIKHAGAGGEPFVLNTRDFNIQISTNGQDFATAVRVLANAKSVSVHTIPTALARFVRLNVTTPAQHGDNSSRIYELEVHCEPTKTHRSGIDSVMSCQAL